jgi:hypothetical protein
MLALISLWLALDANVLVVNIAAVIGSDEQKL